jgi:hypothetical protein
VQRYEENNYWQAKNSISFRKRIRSAEFEGLKLELIIGIPTTFFLDEDAFFTENNWTFLRKAERPPQNSICWALLFSR